MFRSMIIIRELVLNLAKVIFMLKCSVKVRRYMLFGDVAAWHRAACVLCAVHTTHTPFHDMQPHHQITDNDVILPSVLT
jgi:hypothetical protein